MKTIEIKPGFSVIIDDQDLDLISRHKWRILKGRHTHYAMTTINKKQIGMHRLLLNPPKGMPVDHINRNGLDNRRNNIRVVSVAQNANNHHKGDNLGAFMKGFERLESLDWINQS